MCSPGNWGCRSRSNKITIAKSEVESIIKSNNDLILLWKPFRCRLYREYSVTPDELIQTLNDEFTKVSVANTTTPEYLNGYQNIVIDARSPKAKILIRRKV